MGCLFNPLQKFMVGVLFWHSGTVAPHGSFAVPVAATYISRAAYPALHALYAGQGYPYGSGDGSTTFGIPFVPNNYTLLNSSSSLGVSTVGEVISHAHTPRINGGAGSSFVLQNTTASIGGLPDMINPTGGAANLAAGVRHLLCLQYL